MATKHKEMGRWQAVGLLHSWLRQTFSFADPIRDPNFFWNLHSPKGALQDGAPRELIQQGDNQKSTQVEIGVDARGSDRPQEFALRSSAVVLPFPIHSDALLVRLAHLLRQRVGAGRPMQEPFLFEIVRGGIPKLYIDAKSHVAFVPSQGEFLLEIEVKPSTDIAIRTDDFDTLVEFVVQYIGARLAERPPFEAM